MNKICSFFHKLLLSLVFAGLSGILFGHAPLNYSIIENKGQWPEHVKFGVELPEGFLFFETNTLTYHFKDYSDLIEVHATNTDSIDQENIILKEHTYKVNMRGGNKSVQIIPFDKKEQYYNYFIGPEENWAGHVSAFGRIMYQNIYPKIDLIFYSKNGSLKYDFIVRKGADMSLIKLEYLGTDILKLKNGELIIGTSVNQVIEEKPYAYMKENGIEKKIEVNYTLKKNILSFSVPKQVLKKDLVIDPSLIFASYSGSTANNFGMSATYDNDGHLYAGGIAFNNGYDTTLGAFQTTFANTQASGITDVVVSKYAPDGSSFIYSTYLGGNGTETVHSMIVNDNDELYLYGATSSDNFPTSPGAYQTIFGGGNGLYFTSNGTNFINGTDIYVTKFNNTGTALIGSTYIGGSKNDGINYNPSNTALYDSLNFNYGDQFRGEIMLDDNDNCYITSMTQSSNFPIVNGFQNTFGGVQDAIVVKFNPNLTSVNWSTYLGGSNKDAGYGIKIDNAGNVFVSGGTASTDFPTNAGAYQTTYQGGLTDGFITKLNASATAFLSSTYIGTSSYDQAFFLELDGFNSPYILGQSLGSMPVSPLGVYVNPNSKQFISKLDPNLNGLTFSTVFGNGNGNVNFSPSAFLVDQCQNVYISGWGGSLLAGSQPMNGMPTTAGALYPNSLNGYDYYFAVFERDMQNLLYGSYFGGSTSDEHVDGGTSRFDKRGVVYQSVCAGCQNNDDFPTTPGVVSATNNSSGCNNGTFKFDFENVVTAQFTSSDTSVCGPTLVTLTNESIGADIYEWDFGNGTGATGTTDTTILYSNQGIYYINLIAIDTICLISDTTQTIIRVTAPINYNRPNDTVLCSLDPVTLSPFVSGGGIDYSWSLNPNGNPELHNGSPFTYDAQGVNTNLYLTISESSCTLYDTLNISYDTIVASYSTELSTCGACDGTATINGQVNYSYQWDDPSNQTTASATGLCVGSYNVTISNPAGCVEVLSIMVDDTVDLNLVISDTAVTCAGACDGTIHIDHFGGTAPFNYLWSHGPSSQSVGNLCPGIYFVTITDAALCQAVREITITEPTPISILSSNITEIDCYNNCNGSIQLNATGGTPIYSYTWSNGQTGNNISGLCNGAYTVSITDQNNCSYDTTFNLNNPAEFLISTETSLPICFSNCEGFIDATIIGGTTPISYQLDNGNAQQSSLFNNLCPGTYTIEATDANGCSISDIASITTTSFTSFPLNLEASSDTINEFSSTNISANPEGDGIFLWTPSELFSNPTHLSQTVSPSSTTTYTFTVANLDNPECTFDSSITIYVVEYLCEDPSIFVPNAFTPNGDNINDKLMVNGRLLTDLYFTIYNRWGEPVFETNDIANGWDGTYKGKESDAGVFDYYLEATCPTQEKIFIKGNITLIR